MTILPPAQNPTPDGCDRLRPIFSVTADGVLAAQVGDTAFAMLPAREGGFFTATAWRISRPMTDWKRSDFYSHGGDIINEAAFRAQVEENAVHQQQRRALARRETMPRVKTPWGMSQSATIYEDGVVFYSTASHGGFCLDRKHNALVHPALRAEDGWYEEDCCWAIVALTFPTLFTDYEQRCADTTIRNYYPDAWETLHGAVLNPGESCEKDRRDFERTHASDWVVISAIHSAQHPGMTECVATLGGRRKAPEQRRYLVPSDEYRVGRCGFVIDESRHRLYDGPSSFVGWKR